MNITALARAKGCTPEDITVCMLDRPRHDELAHRVTSTGARMNFITDGELLHGVRYGRDRAITESLVIRSRSGTVRQVRSTHHLNRLV